MGMLCGGERHHRKNGSSRRRVLQVGAGSALAALTSRLARSENYPSGPITVILPVPPGSVLDVIGRGASAVFKRDLHYPFVIENISGAASNIGAARVAHAKPDGKTVLLTVSSPISTNAFLYKDMPFDPQKDLAPVILTGTAPVTLAVHKSLPVRSVQEFIDYARAHPGKIAYGSSGIGSPQHLCGEYLASLTGIKLIHVPYKGGTESALDVIAGHIPAAFTTFALVVEQAKAGDVRILATADDQRSPIIPDVPIIRETVPAFVHAPGAWQAMLVPSHTPEEIISILNHEMNVALKDPDVVAQLRRVYITPIGGPPEALLEKIRYEQDVTRVLVAKVGIVPQ